MSRWLSRYLSKLILIPGIILLAVVGLDLISAIGQYSSARFVIKAAMLTEYSNDLIHELQKERGCRRVFSAPVVKTLVPNCAASAN